MIPQTSIYEVKYRFDIDGEQIYPYDAPTIVMDAESELKLALRGRFHQFDSRDLMFFNDDGQVRTLNVSVIINGEAYNFGRFVITGETIHNEGGVIYHELEGYSLLYLLKQSRIENRYYFAAGTPYTTVLYQILTDAGISNFYIQPKDLNLATARSEWEIGTDRLTIINSLLSEMSFADAYIDHNGLITLAGSKLPNLANVQITYSEGQYSIIGRDFTKTADYYQKPNVFRFVCANPDLPQPRYYTFTDNAKWSPFSIVHRPRVFKVVEVDNIANKDALAAYAWQYFYRNLLSEETVSFETMLNPEHTAAGQIIAIGNGELTGIFKEVGWSATLDSSARMTHRARRWLTL